MNKNLWPLTTKNLFFCFLDILFSQRRVDAPAGLSYEPNRLSCDDWNFCNVFCFAENYFFALLNMLRAKTINKRSSVHKIKITLPTIDVF